MKTSGEKEIKDKETSKKREREEKRGCIVKCTVQRTNLLLAGLSILPSETPTCRSQPSPYPLLKHNTVLPPISLHPFPQ